MRWLLVAGLFACGRIDFATYDAHVDTAGDGVPATARCGFVEVAVGRTHSCARRGDGTVACWGLDSKGQVTGAPAIGAGAGVRLVPTDIALGQPAEQLAVGAWFSCALLADGSVTCWGSNDSGELGLGDAVAHDGFVSTLPAGSAVQVVAGSYHSCARRAAGTVVCWGENNNGQIGTGATSMLEPPRDVPGLTGATFVAAGHQHTCTLLPGGTGACWGQNGDHQLGDNTATNPRPSPVAVVGLTGALTLFGGGRDTCATYGDGSVRCWGRNDAGQEGTGDVVGDNTPGRTASLSPAKAITLGSRHACALLESGQVACWGDGDFGVLGNGTLDSQVLAPAIVTDPGEVTMLATHHKHTCAVHADGTVSCWGSNNYGELGIGTRSVLPPTNVLANVTSFTMASGHSCAIAANALQCWGQNGDGRLGTGTTLGADSPQPVAMAGPVAVSSGVLHTCAIDSARNLWCWGSNWTGQLGLSGGNSRLAPVQTAYTAVDLLDVGGHFTCLSSGKTVSCFGHNAVGELGDGTTNMVTGAVDHSFPSTPMQIAAGHWSACVLLATGEIDCWGRNDLGQLGDGTSTERDAPVLGALGISGAKKISLEEHGCAIDGSDLIWCWGGNSDGQVGDGTLIDRTLPVRVMGLPAMKDVVAGEGFSCGVSTSGDVYCWGANDTGQLGVDTSGDQSSTPVLVPGAGPATSVLAGNGHACANGTDGVLRCWGNNDNGQVGVSTADHTVPVAASCLP